MLRAALALLSTLQIGARIKESLERSLRQAIVIAVAAVLLVAAAVFGLLAAYHALVSLYQFSALEAAAIMAACLLLIGLIVVAILPLVGRQPKRATTTRLIRYVLVSVSVCKHPLLKLLDMTEQSVLRKAVPHPIRVFCGCETGVEEGLG
jgi:membrane-associated HD superfamily phosphohydrolase